MIGKLVSDASYRAAYCALWNTQRKAAVSVLLPHTYTPEPGAEASSASSGPGPAGRAGGKAKAPPPKPQGEAKARAIIAAVMQVRRPAPPLTCVGSTARVAEYTLKNAKIMLCTPLFSPFCIRLH